MSINDLSPEAYDTLLEVYDTLLDLKVDDMSSICITQLKHHIFKCHGIEITSAGTISLMSLAVSNNS